jgi:hypothetical protein
VAAKVMVQAGAFVAPAAAQAGLAKLAAAGFGGFIVVGAAPYKLMRGDLSRPDAQQLVAALMAKGFPALLVAH